MLNNRIQIFSELVSLEAWHMPFTTRRNSVGLHADITFSTARLGQDVDCPVRFKMRLRKATLTVVVPETEALLVDRSTVARFDASTAGVRKVRASRKLKAQTSGGIAITAGPAGLAPSANLSASGAAATELSEETTLTSKFDAILVRHSLDVNGSDRWHFSPASEATLVGKPWAAADTPLMKLKDGEGNGNRRVGGTVRLELSCLREDLDIFDIELKDKSKIPLANLRSSKRLIAAEAYIRTRILSEGLPGPLMSESFALITLARVNSIEGGW